jgi:tetratricopeptide (TPR) repeat protein
MERKIGDRMDKNAKYYKKALEKYHNGDLEKAIIFCEKGISSSLKNFAALNLKGLLMYFKGNLSEAKALWKLNKDYNKDEVAKKYLESLKDDKKRLALYERSDSLIKEMKFKEALDLLIECKKSDFNLIAVQNALTKVYIHLGQYEEAKICIDKVLEVDRNNKEAKENRKLLVDYRVIEKQYNYKKMAFTVSSVLLVAVTLSILIPRLRTAKSNKANNNYASSIKGNEKKNQENKKQEENPPKESKAEVKEEVPKDIEEKLFPSDKLNSALENKEFNTLYSILTDYSLEDLREEDKLPYKMAKELMEDEAVEYFYTIARDFHTKDQYKAALEEYRKLELLAEEHYLYESVIYMLADCYKSINEMDKAIDYYEKYLSLEEKTGYEDTVLYEMVLIYKDIDKNKAKAFAKEIRDRFKDSIYNNSVVEEILNTK